MPFKENNQHWKIAFENGTIGRPRIYDDPKQLAELINKWIEITEQSSWDKEDFIKSGSTAGQKVFLKTATPFLIQDLCLYLGVNPEYFNDLQTSLENMKDLEKKNEFSRIISHVKNVITVQKLQGATTGAYNPMIVARIEGLKEKTDITTNDKDIQGTNIVLSREDYQALSSNIDNEV